ncbi:MAG TPA: TolC family protein [Planctomycetota bacterium]|nr:TolC family protein [Planctomycetota bacterium]
MAAARARVSQAEERRRATTLVPDPVFHAEFGRGEPRDGGASRSESAFEVSQSLPAPWGLRSRKTAGTAAIAAATSQLDGVILDVLFEARTLYYEAALGTARAAALSQAAEDARSLSDLVARRVEVGEAPGSDHLRTRVEALRAVSEARAAAAQAEGARAALNRFLLGALGSDFTLPTDLDPSDLTPLPDGSVELGVSRNPGVRAAESRVEAARSTVAAEKAARLPGLEFSAFALKELDRKATGAAVGIAIPLWNRNKAGVGLARAELAEAESEASALRANIEADVERLVRKDRASRDNAAAYRMEILPAARETLDIMRNSLEQGEANLLAWLEARRSYLEILRASYEAQLDAFLTRAELVRLTGGFDATESR